MSSIEYSDGSGTENEIVRLLKKTRDLSADTLIVSHRYSDWPIRYHLCPERANLLRPFDFSGLQVLELGAGMGALSRFLAERCAKLTVVEGTERRFTALQERLRDLNNWEGTVCNIEQVRYGAQFDVVCVIGVLEYFQLYFEPKTLESFPAFLQKARSFLKPGGVLLLAIENSLGIKYWSGAPEDHLGTLFSGLCGYPQGPSPKTFCRKQLRVWLEQSGLHSVREYYPFPDYKLPFAILSESLVKQNPGLAYEIATSRPIDEVPLRAPRYFPPSLALKSLTQAGLFADFANSFLFMASETEQSPTKAKMIGSEPALAWHYSWQRKIPTHTVFSSSAKGIRIRKVRAGQGGETSVSWKGADEQSAQSGESLKPLLMRYAYFGEWKLFFRTFYDFLTWSFSHWQISDKPQELKPDCLDAIVSNAKKTDSDYELFDLEWRANQPVPKSWFILRNLLTLSTDSALFSPDFPHRTLADWYRELCDTFGTWAQLPIDLEKEALLQSDVHYTGDSTIQLNRLQSLFTNPLRIGVFPRSPRREWTLQFWGEKLVNPAVRLVKRVPGWKKNPSEKQ